jgi:hypothetical protein
LSSNGIGEGENVMGKEKTTVQASVTRLVSTGPPQSGFTAWFGLFLRSEKNKLNRDLLKSNQPNALTSCCLTKE